MPDRLAERFVLPARATTRGTVLLDIIYSGSLAGRLLVRLVTKLWLCLSRNPQFVRPAPLSLHRSLAVEAERGRCP